MPIAEVCPRTEIRPPLLTPPANEVAASTAPDAKLPVTTTVPLLVRPPAKVEGVARMPTPEPADETVIRPPVALVIEPPIDAPCATIPLAGPIACETLIAPALRMLP